MYIQQIRSATLKITYGGTVFLIDPWFQDKGTGFSVDAADPKMRGVKCPLNDLPDTPEHILEGVDICLVTHLHFDHFSPDYLPVHLRIIAQNENEANRLKTQGFANTGCFDSGSVKIGNVTIHKTAAVHGDNAALIDQQGDACGYLFEAPDEKRLYLAGDTIYCRAVVETIEKYHPKVIILNCCGATKTNGRLIMDLPEVEQVCKDAPEAVVIASHLDSVNHATVTSDDIRKFVLDKNLRQVLVPRNGDVIEA